MTVRTKRSKRVQSKVRSKKMRRTSLKGISKANELMDFYEKNR